MEMTGWILFFAFLFVAIAALIGGKVTIGPKGLSLDTKGILELILKARKQKGISAEPEVGDVKLPQSDKLPTATVLWIDDKTENNLYERKALAKLGMHVECYTSNALAKLVFDHVAPDIVISDIGRPGDEDGWQLLTAIRAKSPALPFYFYTGQVTDELETKAKASGATGIHDDPGELVFAVASQMSS